MLSRSFVLSKWLRWACPDDVMPQGLKKHEPLLSTTDNIIGLGDDRLETQPSPTLQHEDNVLKQHTLDDETHTMVG